MAFDDIYKEYWQKVFRICMGYVNDHNLAKDLAQETFIKIWQKLPQFRSESAISTWIYRIASNNCLRQLERSNKRNESEILHDVEDQIEENNEHNFKLLYQCIAELKSIDRIIISLELEDVNQKEIAKIVGISEGNVRIKILRIKEKLTQKFKRYE